MNRFVAFFVLVAGGTPMAAHSCSKQELERGIFGIEWSDSGDEVHRKLPASQFPHGASEQLLMVRGEHEFCGLRIRAFTFRLSEHARNIESADFVVSAGRYLDLTATLEKMLGDPRAVTVSGGNTFSHVVEWSGPHVSVRMQSATRERALNSAAVMDVLMYVKPGPIVESEVSRIESELARRGLTTN